MPGPAKTILVSILSLGRPQNVLNQLDALPAWLAAFAQDSAIDSHIVVRNNDPGTDFQAVAERMALIEAEYRAVTCTLVTGVPNNGFGHGHNSNIALSPSDYVLILNDDIGFPHITWLGEAIGLLDSDERIVCVGATENPKHINPFFGNGLMPGAFHLLTMPYAEASVLLFDRAAFDSLGGFHADYRWAMCEDSDLSLRVQQQGWQIAHISMPHQHWRSTSFNSLPGQVKSSILEHNRAALFANWRESLATGRIGRFVVFDVWSDGIGDVFCALPHLLARLRPLSAARRANVIVNTNHPDLVAMLGLDGVRISKTRDLSQLHAELGQDGVATLRTMRDINFSLPFNIHPLLAGALGIAPAGRDDQGEFRRILYEMRQPACGAKLPTGKYCVVHLEFERAHDGRGLPPGVTADLLAQCGTIFDHIVLVGREHRLSAKLFGDTQAKIVDLQGKLSRADLMAIIAHAGAFVGIDSFPAHVAQASGVRAAIFFGAIHPLTRVLDEDQAWPLTAKLDCIGCYHTHLECSVPFCMRRDVACTTGLDMAEMRSVLRDMADGRPYKWQDFRQSLQSLQSGLIKLTRYHPAPPERLFRSQAIPNEAMSTLIYRMTEQMGTLLRGQYHTTAMTHLAGRAAELESEIFAAQAARDEAIKRSTLPRSTTDPSATKFGTRIVQLTGMTLETERCSTDIVEQWIEIEAQQDDPQITLPPMTGPGGKVQLRLSCMSAPDDALQVYWSTGEAGFSAERVYTVPSTGTLQTVNLALDLHDDEALHIRIDPTTGVGRSRLRGTLGGMFTLLGQRAHQLADADDPSDVSPGMPCPSPEAATLEAPPDASATVPQPARRSGRQKHSIES
jgi:GT2 family glycosyltransferase